MCGICGIYNYRTGVPPPPPLIEAMTRSLIHRGPDDEGILRDGALALGIRRLSIIDLEGGHQPIANEAGTVWVVLNGEIYNFRELRDELQPLGHRFKTRSDTEVVVHAYEQWGLGALSRLNGMFGLALWDSTSRSLVLARDPFGIKPLYVLDDGSRVVFGSEIRAIFADRTVPRTLDLEALDEYLALTFVPSPKTAFTKVEKLLPGHALVCTAGGTRLHRFQREVQGLIEPRSEEDLVQELRSEIAAAVRRQMVADVPVGAMLSGGTDSSTVATMMTEIAQAPIDTFTVGFAGDFAQNELAAARATAARIGSQHHEVVLSAGEYLDLLPKAVTHLEDLVANPSALPYYGVCALASRHVKVVLTGQGADEPFAGYARYLGQRYGNTYRRIPAGLRRWVVDPLVEGLPRNERLKRAVRSLGTSDPFDRLVRIHTIVDDRLKQDLYRNGDIPRSRYAGIQRWHDDVATLDPLSGMLYVDARTSLADNYLMYGDKMAMAVSLEARVPFLDLRLMSLVESIPPHFKIRGRQQKYILKRAIAPWLPPDVLTRPKIGFTTPVDRWFRGDLREQVTERLLTPGSACTQYFEPAVIRRMIQDHERGRQDYKRALFSLLIFELWHEQFIATAPLAAA